MDEKRQDNQLEPIYNSCVPIQDVDLKTYRERWTIETGGERESKGNPCWKCDIMIYIYIYIYFIALQPEEITFHVRTINKSAYSKKSLETYLMILLIWFLFNLLRDL